MGVCILQILVNLIKIAINISAILTAIKNITHIFN